MRPAPDLSRFLDWLCEGRGWSERCQPGLEKLANKSSTLPEFARYVAHDHRLCLREEFNLRLAEYAGAMSTPFPDDSAEAI